MVDAPHATYQKDGKIEYKVAELALSVSIYSVGTLKALLHDALFHSHFFFCFFLLRFSSRFGYQYVGIENVRKTRENKENVSPTRKIFFCITPRIG